MNGPSKGENMIKQSELIDMTLFENSGFFNPHELNSIANRTKEQWTSSVDEFAHVCFTANGGAFAFVIVRKSRSTIHSRIFGCHNDRVEIGDLFREGHTVAIGRWTLIQGDYSSVGANRLRIPYDYGGVVGRTPWTDGFNGGHSSQDIAEEVFNDCLESFKQAELEGMIQNLSIISTSSEYGEALRTPVIKLMDLELF